MRWRVAKKLIHREYRRVCDGGQWNPRLRARHVERFFNRQQRRHPTSAHKRHALRMRSWQVPF